MYLIKIGTYELPMPSEYVGTESTIVNSARNAQGVMVGSVIRESVAKVECTWNFLTKEQWATILQLFRSSNGSGSNFIREVKFFNQTTGNYTTKKMYVGDRTTGGIFAMDEQGNVIGYKKPKLSLIEV